MARSAITVGSLSLNAASNITKDAMDVSNDHQIDVSNIPTGDLVILIETDAGTKGTLTVKAGDYAQASIGDLAITLGASNVKAITVDSARFKDSDGLILIDLATTGTLTGYISAIQVP